MASGLPFDQAQDRLDQQIFSQLRNSYQFLPGVSWEVEAKGLDQYGSGSRRLCRLVVGLGSTRRERWSREPKAAPDSKRHLRTGAVSGRARVGAARD